MKCSTDGDLVTLLVKTLISLKIYPKILLVKYGLGGYAITWAFSFTATPFELEDFYVKNVQGCVCTCVEKENDF